MGWYNSDGLYVKFGQEEGQSAVLGEVRTAGVNRELVLTLDLTTLASTDTILDYTTYLPKDAFIESVTVETLTSATSGGSATLSVGLYKSDTTTAISATALVSALAVATVGNAGTQNILTLGSTGAGAKIGSTPGFPALLSAKYGTAAFTAGVVSIRIQWSKGNQ
jgi:hypothetical protein